MSFFQRILLFVSLPLYALDQWSKWWVVGHFQEPLQGTHSSYIAEPVIEGYFNLVRVHNQGVAFGFGNGTVWAPFVFLFVPVIAVTVLRICWKKNLFPNKLSQLAVALLLSGIFGNLTDRLLQGSHLSYMKGAPLWDRLVAGYVVDFLDFTIPIINYQWPSFNVADSCVCVAATLLFLGGLQEEREKKAA